MPPQEERTAVVPDSFFRTLGSRLVKAFGASVAESVLYDIGKDSGRAFTRMAGRHFGHPLREADDISLLLEMFGREYRWAEITLKKVEVDGKFLIIEWRNGIGVPHGGRTHPVCHLGRGLLSGAAETIFGAACDAIETQCQAMGADHCEIVVGVPDRIIDVAEGLGGASGTR